MTTDLWLDIVRLVDEFSLAESGSREGPFSVSVWVRPRSCVASSAREPVVARGDAAVRETPSGAYPFATSPRVTSVVGHGGWRVPAADAPPAPEPSANTAGRGLRGLTLEAGA